MTLAQQKEGEAMYGIAKGWWLLVLVLELEQMTLSSLFFVAELWAWIGFLEQGARSYDVDVR